MKQSIQPLERYLTKEDKEVYDKVIKLADQLRALARAKAKIDKNHDDSYSKKQIASHLKSALKHYESIQKKVEKYSNLHDN